MKIEKSILDRIIKSKDETVTENVDLVYEFLSEQLPKFLIKTKNHHHSSYGIKHRIERILGVYVSNLDIKYCMEVLGVKSWPNGINYYYPISEKWYKKMGKLSDERWEERQREKANDM